LKPAYLERLCVNLQGTSPRVVREDGANDPIRQRVLALVYTPTRDDEEGVSTWAQADAKAMENARLFAGAPGMARALKNLFGEAGHLTICHALRDPKRPCHPDCRQAREALIVAGVPLP
jgi:hypothetical protein